MKFARITVGALILGLTGLGMFGTQPEAGRAQTETPINGQQGANRNGYQTGIYSADVVNVQGGEVNVDRQVGGLVGEYSRTQDEAKRAKIKTKLTELLDKQFDLQQKRRDQEVKNIEDQLKKLREVMRKRSEARQTIVEKRLDQLLREAEGLGWSAPHSGNANYAPLLFQHGGNRLILTKPELNKE